MSEPRLADTASEVIRGVRSLEESYLLGIEGVTEVWLVRHADVYDDLEELDDPPLSRRGAEQAARLAKRLEALDFAAVYASPSRRAKDTARALNRQIETDPRFAEAAASFDGGKLTVLEQPQDVAARMRAAVESAVASHPGGRLLVVSHGLAIMAFLGDVLGIEPSKLRIYPPFTGVSIVRVKDGQRVVATIFDTAHLHDMP